MTGLSENERVVIDSLFETQSFGNMYDVIHSIYKQKELGLDLTDEDRIAEYKYITEQLRKFISTKQDTILSANGDLELMISFVKSLAESGDEYMTERKKFVYSILRDNWIIELYNGISYLLNERLGSDE